MLYTNRFGVECRDELGTDEALEFVLEVLE